MVGLMLSVLAQAALTKYRRLGGLDSRHLCHMVLEAANLRAGWQVSSGEIPHTAERERKNPLVF